MVLVFALWNIEPLNFLKVHLCMGVWAMLWCVKTLKISKFTSVRPCAVGCKHFKMFKVPLCWNIVVIVMRYVQTLKILSFLVWGLCVKVRKPVEIFKVPCVWVDLILKRLFSEKTYRISFPVPESFFQQKILVLIIEEITAPSSRKKTLNQ